MNETGDLLNEQEVLNWLTHQVQHEEIEEITNEMLDILIKQKKHLAVLFCKIDTFFSWFEMLTLSSHLDDEDDTTNGDILAGLETIDDECDQRGVSFVRLDSESEEQEYGIETTPALVYFEDGIPSLYEGTLALNLKRNEDLAEMFIQTGDLSKEEQVLDWLTHQVKNEEIEEVTDEMLDQLISQKKHLAVLFCKWPLRWNGGLDRLIFRLNTDNDDQKESIRALGELENIDDECDSTGVAFVKIDDLAEAKEYGVDKIPGLVYFEDGIPALYEGMRPMTFLEENSFWMKRLGAGDLSKEEEVLKWLSRQVQSDEIEDVTDEMLDMLIEKKKHLAVLFCKTALHNLFRCIHILCKFWRWWEGEGHPGPHRRTGEHRRRMRRQGHLFRAHRQFVRGDRVRHRRCARFGLLRERSAFPLRR